MRTFDTGATRDSEEEKLDYEGFFSPSALEVYAQYMHGHRFQADGVLRASDNWQKGMPLSSYMKSLFRHFFTVWRLHREPGAWTPDTRANMISALCGVLFNTFGYLHEFLLEGAEPGEQPGAVRFLQGEPPVGWTETEGLTEGNKPGTFTPSG